MWWVNSFLWEILKPCWMVLKCQWSSSTQIGDGPSHYISRHWAVMPQNPSPSDIWTFFKKTATPHHRDTLSGLCLDCCFPPASRWGCQLFFYWFWMYDSWITHSEVLLPNSSRTKPGFSCSPLRKVELQAESRDYSKEFIYRSHMFSDCT